MRMLQVISPRITGSRSRLVNIMAQTSDRAPRSRDAGRAHPATRPRATCPAPGDRARQSRRGRSRRRSAPGARRSFPARSRCAGSPPPKTRTSGRTAHPSAAASRSRPRRPSGGRWPAACNSSDRSRSWRRAARLLSAARARAVVPRARPNSFTSGRKRIACSRLWTATAEPAPSTQTSGTGGLGARFTASAKGRPSQRRRPFHGQSRMPRNAAGRDHAGPLATLICA